MKDYFCCIGEHGQAETCPDSGEKDKTYFDAVSSSCEVTNLSFEETLEQFSCTSGSEKFEISFYDPITNCTVEGTGVYNPHGAEIE